MARPEDSAARNNTRNAGGIDPSQGGLRRDARQPLDQRGREEPTLRAQTPPPQASRGPGPGQTPQFDPYMPQQVPRQSAPQARPDPRIGYPADQRAYEPRRDLPPQQQQNFAPDPYAQPRTARPNGQAAMPNTQPAPARGGQTQRPAPQGYPPQQGLTQQSVPPQSGYVPLQGQPARGVPTASGGYDQAPASGRNREPFFEAPASARQSVPARQNSLAAQDGYGDDAYGEIVPPRRLDAQYDDDEDEEPLEEHREASAPRRSRALQVALALVIAVGLGGGLGYVYKTSGSHRAVSSAGPMVVEADTAPVKVVPVEASVPAADPNKKTILERADAAAPAAPATTVPSQEAVAVKTDATAPADALAGPRKVATVVVKPGEKIAAMAPALPDAQPVDAVPGFSVAGEDQQPAADMPTAPAAAAVTAANADPAAQPVKLGKLAAKKAAAAAAAGPAAPAAPAAPADTAMADPVPADPTAPAKMKVASATASPKAGGGSGYLIQVRSTKTQEEALAYFADLQQKYGELLGSSQPDIQTADLGAKGTWYRLRIGPPGSSAAAHDLCVKLKASGLKDCITAAY